MITESARTLLILLAILLTIVIVAGWVWMANNTDLVYILFKPLLAIFLLLLLLACPVGMIVAAHKCTSYPNLIVVWGVLLILPVGIPAAHIIPDTLYRKECRQKQEKLAALGTLLLDTAATWEQVKSYMPETVENLEDMFVRILANRRTDLAAQMVHAENFNPEQEIGFAEILARLYPEDRENAPLWSPEGMDSVADFLLQEGGNLNATADLGRFIKNASALCLAAEAADTATCRLLIDKGIDLTVRTADNRTALYYAVGHKENAAIVRQMLEKDTTGINLRSLNSYTPLLYAVDTEESDNIEIIRLLLDYGADANAEDRDGNTVLTYALDHPEITRLLLERGVNPRQTNSEGRTLLMLAARQGDIQNVSACLQLGLDVNARDVEDYNVLHYAATSGSLECVKLLIDYGADVNYITPTGETLLFTAAYSEDSRILKLLLDKGLDVKKRDRYGRDALYMALTNHCYENMKMLIKHGAPTDRTYGEDKKTMEVIATEYCNEDSLGMMMEYLTAAKAAERRKREQKR